jgi:hypothetical protein
MVKICVNFVIVWSHPRQAGVSLKTFQLKNVWEWKILDISQTGRSYSMSVHIGKSFFCTSIKIKIVELFFRFFPIVLYVCMNYQITTKLCPFFNYRKNALREQKVYLNNSTLGGFNLKVDAGLNEKYCLTTKDGVLYNSDCRATSFDQTWRFNPVRGQTNQYLIMQYSSKKCLVPRSRSNGASIKLAPCNSLQTEQIWKICTAAR